MIKWIIGVIVIVAVGAALMWSGVLGKFPPPQTAQAPATQTPPADTTAQNTQQAPANDLPTQQTDASDGALVQDTAAVDTQMQGLSSDSSSVDSSMNDKATAQEF